MLIKLLCLPTYVPIFYEYMNVLSLIPHVFIEGRDDYRFTLLTCTLTTDLRPHRFLQNQFLKKLVAIVLYLVRAAQMEEF